MRRPFTTQQAMGNGISKSALAWGVRRGCYQDVGRGVYLKGSDPATSEELAAAEVIRRGGIAWGTFAALLHGLDGIKLIPPYVRDGDGDVDVRDYPCADGTQTMLSLAAALDDIAWEQALESALRKRLTTIEDLEVALSVRRRGNSRIRRVLALRPTGAPPTGSVLETMMVQLVRKDATLPTPERQVEVRNSYGDFVANVDLAWPEHGVFLELDGQQHKDQPVYDARRETAVVATTGWLPGRFTWHEVVNVPKPTLRRVAQLFDAAQALRRSA